MTKFHDQRKNFLNFFNYPFLVFTCDYIDKGLRNFILLLTVVLILLLVIAGLCMTGVRAYFKALMMGFVQWIARLRSRDGINLVEKFFKLIILEE
jgi:hypothetical protein